MSLHAPPLSPTELRHDDDRAIVVPTRGGMVTRWSSKQRELFFLDETTVLDATKNVRGGNPVLFPSPGRLASDRWSRGGASGQLKQHGFARNLPWKTLEQGGDTITLGLEACEATRGDYPFDFEAIFAYTLRPGALAVSMSVRNRGGEAMPFGVGFHPYFAVPDALKGKTTVETAASRAFDNVTKREVPYRLDLASGEVDLHLIDHQGSSARLRWPGGAVSLEGSPEFRRWVIWTLPGKDFVCLEPWTCPADALNTGEGLIELAPGEERRLSLTMRHEPGG